MNLTPSQKRNIVTLTKEVQQAIAQVDTLMQPPMTAEKDKEVARIINGLEVVNDRVRHFVLGEKL